MPVYRKFWAKKDIIYLNEFSNEQAEIDPFKKSRIIVKLKE